MRWPLLLRKANIPKIHFQAESFLHQPPNGLESAYRAVHTYIQGLKDYVPSGFGLLLQGDVGTSKTTLSVAVGMMYMRLVCQDQLTDPYDASGETLHPPVYYFSALDLAGMLFGVEKQERNRIERTLERVPLLIWDDLGYERPYDENAQANFLTVFVQSLIEKRHKECRTTIFTTNLTNAELNKIYNQGTIQRLAEKNHRVLMQGPSLRKKFLLPDL